MFHLRVVPGLWVAAEECRRPELRAHPVIMGGLPHERGIVREASFSARERGVQPGMTLSQAYQLCPDGIFLAPDLPRYEAIWRGILDVLRQFTPLVEPLEMGQAACDLSGCERHWPDRRAAARAIVSEVWRESGIVPCVGVATNRLVAELASLTVESDGVGVVEPGGERGFLADLLITRLPGVDERLALTFQVLGLRTVGQLAALPASAVRQRFGSTGAQLHAYARGIDPRPVTPPPVRQVISARYECEDGSAEEALAAIERLAGECANELCRRSLAGRMVELTLLWEDERGGQGQYRRNEPGPAQGHDPSMVVPTSEECRDNPPVVVPDSPVVAAAMRASLPIPYRIHSMLPQPGAWSDVETGQPHLPAAVSHVSPERQDTPWIPPSFQPRTVAGTVVRTPVSEAAPLAQRARYLLEKHWPRDEHRGLHAVELTISEFERPVQLGFAELNRVAESGALAGMSGDRLRTLMQQEEVLAARYGDASFRRLDRIDPANLLADRRFRWTSGLPWTAGGKHP